MDTTTGYCPNEASVKSTPVMQGLTSRRHTTRCNHSSAPICLCNEPNLSETKVTSGLSKFSSMLAAKVVHKKLLLTKEEIE